MDKITIGEILSRLKIMSSTSVRVGRHRVITQIVVDNLAKEIENDYPAQQFERPDRFPALEISTAIGLLEGTIKGMKAFGNFNKEGALESLEEVKTILEKYSPDNDSGQGWISRKELIDFVDHLGEMGWYKEKNGKWTHDDVIGYFEKTEDLVKHYLPTPPNESK